MDVLLPLREPTHGEYGKNILMEFLDFEQRKESIGFKKLFHYFMNKSKIE